MTLLQGTGIGATTSPEQGGMVQGFSAGGGEAVQHFCDFCLRRRHFSRCVCRLTKPSLVYVITYELRNYGDPASIGSVLPRL